MVFRRSESSIGELILGTAKSLDPHKIANKLASMLSNHRTERYNGAEYVSKMTKEEHQADWVQAGKTHHTTPSTSPNPDDFREL